MEILHPLRAKVWEDPYAWAEEVLILAELNEVSLAGIRDFRAKLKERKLDTDGVIWLQETVNKGLEDSGIWLHYKYGLVVG